MANNIGSVLNKNSLNLGMASGLNRQEELSELHRHCDLFYRLMAEATPNGHFEKIDHAVRCLTKSEEPFHNSIRGRPLKETDWDAFICSQLSYYEHFNTPFVWLVDEADQKFKEKLIQYSFKDAGVLQGVIGASKGVLPGCDLPIGISVEKVENEKTLDEYNSLFSKVFGYSQNTQNFYKKFLKIVQLTKDSEMVHWVAKKEGKVIATLTSLIQGKTVSFWNGATASECRRQGIGEALSRLAVQDAIAKGCVRGATYLMADELALGISRKLGAETKWRFHAFISPPKRKSAL